MAQMAAKQQEAAKAAAAEFITKAADQVQHVIDSAEAAQAVASARELAKLESSRADKLACFFLHLAGSDRAAHNPVEQQPSAQTSLKGQPFEVFCVKAVSQRHASRHISSRVLLAFQPKMRSAFVGSAQHSATSPGRRSAMR